MYSIVKGTKLFRPQCVVAKGFKFSTKLRSILIFAYSIGKRFKFISTTLCIVINDTCCKRSIHTIAYSISKEHQTFSKTLFSGVKSSSSKKISICSRYCVFDEYLFYKLSGTRRYKLLRQLLRLNNSSESITLIIITGFREKATSRNWVKGMGTKNEKQVPLINSTTSTHVPSQVIPILCNCFKLLSLVNASLLSFHHFA